MSEIHDLSKAQKEALDAMIEAVEAGMPLFAGPQTKVDSFLLKALGRVLEDLRTARYPEPPSGRVRNAPGRGGIVLLKDVRNASGLGLAGAKRICEEAEWNRDRAMEMVRERGE